MSENDDAFGGKFSEFLGDVRPGQTVSMAGRLRYRQGNDPRDWSGPGGSKYLPHDWFMQCGAKRWSGGARRSGGFEVFFPVPFGDGPIVLVTCAGTFPPFEEVRFQSTIQSSAAIEVYWWSTNNLTKVYISWLALGPIGLK